MRLLGVLLFLRERLGGARLLPTAVVLVDDIRVGARRREDLTALIGLGNGLRMHRLGLLDGLHVNRAFHLAREAERRAPREVGDRELASFEPLTLRTRDIRERFLELALGELAALVLRPRPLDLAERVCVGARALVDFLSANSLERV